MTNKIKNMNKRSGSLGSVDKAIFQKYAIPAGICLALTSMSVISEAADPASIGIIKNVVDSIVNLIKNEGKYGLQILSAAGGGLHAAKTSSWQPLLVGAGAAGIIEVLFQAIK